MIPMWIGSLKDTQLVASILSAFILAIIGIFQISLWAEDLPSRKAKKEVKEGFVTLLAGIVCLVFGLYVLVPAMIIGAICLVWMLGQAGYLAFKKDEQE